MEAQALPIVGTSIMEVTKVKLKTNNLINSFVIKFSSNKLSCQIFLNRFAKLLCTKNLKRLPIIIPTVTLKKIGILINNPIIIPILNRTLPEAAILNFDFEFK